MCIYENDISSNGVRLWSHDVIVLCCDFSMAENNLAFEFDSDEEDRPCESFIFLLSVDSSTDIFFCRQNSVMIEWITALWMKQTSFMMSWLNMFSRYFGEILHFYLFDNIS